ncbi:MAG: hypothetical protein JXJ22_15960 [Bacteroidales bacterium]|nr:hypothetical protein [Bacteroidales bacterium]
MNVLLLLKIPGIRRMLFIFDSVLWFGYKIKIKFRKFKWENKRYTIGVTTFLDRYDLYFKKLLKKLVWLFPDNEIIVAINGHYKTAEQQIYLREISRYCAQFNNVKTVSFLQPQGLSKLWNQIILNSSNTSSIIINDDIRVLPLFRKEIQHSGILSKKFCLMKGSFSHFLISKEVIKKVGWFDERFLEIGGEDDDFHVRAEMTGVRQDRIPIYSIKNYGHKLKINSYGKRVDDQQKFYSNYNSEFLYKKWRIENAAFKNSFYIIKSQGNYWKLREGMETPDFYNLKSLKL